MMDFSPHPTDPNLVILKTTPRYIAKHSDEDLRAAVLAEREACAKLCESIRIFGAELFRDAIRARSKHD